MTTEDMIRALGNVIEEYKNKPVFTGQTNIPMMCRDVINKLKELSNPWHTGTPTEEGWYLVKCNEYSVSKYNTDYFRKEQRWAFGFQENYIAWQKIEPYKENEMNPCDACKYYRSEVDLCVAPDRDNCKRR